MFFGATCQQYTLQLANEALHQSISPTTNNTFSYPRLWFPKLTKVQLSMACSTVKMATFLFGLAPGKTLHCKSLYVTYYDFENRFFIYQSSQLQKLVFHSSVFATAQPFASDTSTQMLIGDLNQSDTKSLITIYNLGKPWGGRSTKYYRCQLTAIIIIGSLLNYPLLRLETLIFIRNLRGVLQFGSVVSLAVLMMIYY
jgi:hypothetical protein